MAEFSVRHNGQPQVVGDIVRINTEGGGMQTRYLEGEAEMYVRVDDFEADAVRAVLEQRGFTVKDGLPEHER